jgi:hypothetical protein
MLIIKYLIKYSVQQGLFVLVQIYIMLLQVVLLMPIADSAVQEQVVKWDMPLNASASAPPVFMFQQQAVLVTTIPRQMRWKRVTRVAFLLVLAISHAARRAVAMPKAVAIMFVIAIKLMTSAALAAGVCLAWVLAPPV